MPWSWISTRNLSSQTRYAVHFHFDKPDRPFCFSGFHGPGGTYRRARESAQSSLYSIQEGSTRCGDVSETCLRGAARRGRLRAGLPALCVCGLPGGVSLGSLELCCHKIRKNTKVLDSELLMILCKLTNRTMGYFSLVAILMLLFAGGAEGRMYPTSQQKTKNETSSLIQGLLQGLAETNESGPLYTYWALHQMQAGVPAGYYGFSVTMDVYDLNLNNGQVSAAVVFISNEGNGAKTSLNSIHIGWEVNPSFYGGDSRAHLTAIWTIDGFQNTKCKNLDCPDGFQPERGAAISLGDVIEPASQHNGAKKNSITIKVLKDSKSAAGDWLVYYGLNEAGPSLIGRFPKSLFTGGMADRATSIKFGGAGRARATDAVPMGSGYLSRDNPCVAASFRNIQIFDPIREGKLRFCPRMCPRL